MHWQNMALLSNESWGSDHVLLRKYIGFDDHEKYNLWRASCHKQIASAYLLYPEGQN